MLEIILKVMVVVILLREIYMYSKISNYTDYGKVRVLLHRLAMSYILIIITIALSMLKNY